MDLCARFAFLLSLLAAARGARETSAQLAKSLELSADGTPENFQLSDDPDSPFSRLDKIFKQHDWSSRDRPKIVMVQSPADAFLAPPVVSEIERRLAVKTKVRCKDFDLSMWYLDESGAKVDDTDYGEPESKKDQVKRLEEQAAKVKGLLGELGHDTHVVVFRSMDLSFDSALTADERRAVELVLEYSADVQPHQSSILVLSAWTAWQKEMQELLKKLGFPTPDSDRWVELSGAWSARAESSYVADLFAKGAEGAGGTSAADARKSVRDYFRGHPSYHRLLRMQPQQAQRKSPAELAALIKDLGMRRTKGMVASSLRMASPAARAVVADLLGPAPKQSHDELALGEALSFTAVLKRRQNYYVPPVMRDALYGYCGESPPKKKQAVAPICDVWPDATTSTTTSTSASARVPVWSHLWLAGVIPLVMRRQ